MTAEEEQCVRVLVPAGVLGWGISADEIEVGLALKPHAIAIDAGSTDSGPAYLATGRTKYGRQSIKRDLSLLMDVAPPRRHSPADRLLRHLRLRHGGGSDARDRLEVAREQGDAPRIAVIYSEQDKRRSQGPNAARHGDAAGAGRTAQRRQPRRLQPHRRAAGAGALHRRARGRRRHRARRTHHRHRGARRRPADARRRRGGRLACGQDRRVRRPLHASIRPVPA